MLKESEPGGEAEHERGVLHDEEAAGGGARAARRPRRR